MSVARLSEELAKAGDNIEVYTTTANGAIELDVVPGEQIDVDGVLVTYFNRITKDHTHFSPDLLKALKQKVRYFDAVHVHGWWNPVSVLGALYAVRAKVPVVVSLRGMMSHYSLHNRSGLFKRLIHYTIGRGILKNAHIHATAAAEAEAITRYISPKSISVVPNFVKLGPLRLREPDDRTVLKLLFFSRIDPKKGLDLLLNALPDVKVPYRLTIAGDGEEDYIAQLKNMPVYQSIAQHIDWVGFANDADKFALLRQHHLMVLPSYDENFGNVVIESLSVGTPVLISKQVGLASYVASNNLGWLCDTESASVSNLINHIAVKGQQELDRINKQAPAIIYHDFDDAVLVKMYRDMYQRIIKA